MFLAPGLHSAGTFSRRRNNTFFYQFSHQTKSGMYAEVSIARDSIVSELGRGNLKLLLKEELGTCMCLYLFISCQMSVRYNTMRYSDFVCPSLCVFNCPFLPRMMAMQRFCKALWLFARSELSKLPLPAPGLMSRICSNNIRTKNIYHDIC